METSAPFTNHLAAETSPYLRQHARNPVDWYPWGPEALTRARELGRPIFLSIGYSACHWCHVMEHESFENEEIARILNDNFVSIKVDREERPDLDQIYMTSVQALTGQGGWPMSVFLTPDLKPFTGGTYFPPDDRYGRPGFKRVLLTVAEWWKNRRVDIEQGAAQVTEIVRTSGGLPPGDADAGEEVLRQAVAGLARSFDSRNGGFGEAPKFPRPMDIRLLLRAWKRFSDADALHMARFTLDRMAMGGIYDHLGGGFARYSTDERWLVPHFEKMLYDNALLTVAYCEAFRATGDPLYRNVVEETLAWVQREMTSPEGPFYSTLDADSEGVEGKFYVWTANEIEQLLGKGDAEVFSSVYGVEPEGNWRDPHGHGPVNANILHRVKTLEQSAKLLKLSETDLHQLLSRGRVKLLTQRDGRIRPGRDDKSLTAWNGLMIAGFAEAERTLGNPAYAEVAGKAAEFILTKMRTADGRLLRTWSAGSAPKLNAYLEDYAFLIDGLVSLYEATYAPRWITSALELASLMVDQFWDSADGGFFFTGRDHEALIARNKDPHDNATPSGNAVAVTALLKLVKLTGRDDLADKAEATLKLYRGLLAQHPLSAGQMLIALDFHLGPVDEVAVIGDPSAEGTQRVSRTLGQTFAPNRITAFKPATGDPAADAAVPLLAGKEPIDGEMTVYVCRDFTCQQPLVGAEAALAALGGDQLARAAEKV
jgi:uncharacterized protein YyaL (SSP411 family)